MNVDVRLSRPQVMRTLVWIGTELMKRVGGRNHRLSAADLTKIETVADAIARSLDLAANVQTDWKMPATLSGMLQYGSDGAA